MKQFITFGAGSQNYYEAGERLINQVNSLNIFDKSIFYTDKDLKTDDEFWIVHSNFVENNNRGYGYWLWKPYLIKKTMQTMQKGDILLYLDCGCEVDIRKKETIDKYLEYVRTDCIVGTYTTFIEKEWNKMDLMKKLDAVDEKYFNTVQRQAGALAFLVCEKTINFVNTWYELCCDYCNIDDTPSIEKNLVCFREHRHDQAVFSLLTKKWGLYSDKTLDDCIIYGRNRTGISMLDT